MDNQPREFRNDMGPLLKEAAALVEATKDAAGQNVQEIRKRLTNTLAAAKDVYENVREKTAEKTKRADELVHEFPYRGIGIGVGIGVVIGLILARRD